jgi:thiol-disulfide isomerase/thioredoxin
MSQVSTLIQAICFPPFEFLPLLLISLLDSLIGASLGVAGARAVARKPLAKPHCNPAKSRASPAQSGAQFKFDQPTLPRPMKTVPRSLFLFLSFFVVGLARAVAVGDPVPNCQLVNFADGKPISLKQPGKVVYVDFWASWCGPCAESMPFMDKMNGELKGKGLELIALNVDEEREDADGFLAKRPVRFTVAGNPDGNCPSAFGVMAMPSSYLIDKKGIVRHVQLGFHKGEAADIRKKVEALLVE